MMTYMSIHIISVKSQRSDRGHLFCSVLMSPSLFTYLSVKQFLSCRLSLQTWYLLVSIEKKKIHSNRSLRRKHLSTEEEIVWNFCSDWFSFLFIELLFQEPLVGSDQSFRVKLLKSNSNNFILKDWSDPTNGSWNNFSKSNSKSF